MPNFDYSRWDTTYVIGLIVITIAFMWVLPAMTFWIFRYLNRKGETRDPDEFNTNDPEGFQRL
ncbi:MAG TPA: hypothetical protein VFV50_00120 [Bdellovibrionales bacterium]|nr:hypothetical protein [Bdellovibrionales bacterium]